MSLGTRIFTWWRGELVGTDADGNRYYREKKAVRGRRERRWVVYDGQPEASRVPPEWHGWLHYMTSEPPPPGGRPKRPWQKEHLPNLTGTEVAYRPPGSVLRGGHRQRGTAEYEPWQPS
jgi:NADH:ubiquinone oxidoreductase subunit